MGSDTTGSRVYGLVPGLQKHLGGGTSMMFVLGDPNGVVTPAATGGAPSGCTIAYDSANNQFYQNTVGSTWQKLGSVA